MTEPDKSPKRRAEELLNTVQDGKQVTEIFGDSMERQYTIYGKPIRTWRSYFKVSIPESPNPAQCKALGAKVGNLYQEATFYFAAAEAQLDALSSGKSTEFTAHFNKLVAEYNEKDIRLPASKTLETITEGHVADLKGAIDNAKIIKNFWKRVLDGLVEVRKTIDQETFNNNIIARQEQYGGGGNIPDQLPRRESYGRSGNKQ